MITTYPNNQPSLNNGQHVYGEIFSSFIHESPRAKLPSIVRFLSQGAAAGALLAVLWPVIGMLSHPENGYNLLYLGYLPVIIFAGTLFGSCEGATLWVFSYLIGHRLNFIVRAVLGMVTLLTLSALYIFFLTEPYERATSTTEYLAVFGMYAGCGVVIGLTAGSRFHPLHELIRGTESECRPVMNAMTGLVLRPFVIFALMESVLFLIWEVQARRPQAEFTMAVIAVIHFALGVVLVLARLPFWLLLVSALVINFPIAAFFTDVLKPTDVALRIITFHYLALWAGFVLCRWTIAPSSLPLMNRELSCYSNREE